MNKEIEAALNAQINQEFWSAYLYLSMSMYFAHEGYIGLANWYSVQYKEEQDHALILMNYMNKCFGKVALAPIDGVPTTWDSVIDVFKCALKHEMAVSESINKLYTLATEKHDYATQSMLKWFIDEQVEEVETTTDHIFALERIGDNGFGLYMFDKEMSSRSYKAPEALSSKE